MDAKSLRADRFERILAYGALVLIALILVALVRGLAGGGRISPLILAHMATVAAPLVLTPVMLLRRRGDRWHRALGWIWAVSLFATALISFGIRHGQSGHFSVIHIFSIVTVVTTPLLVLAARRRDLARHRRAARALVTGALLIAGFFTLIPGRMLGGWLWG